MTPNQKIIQVSDGGRSFDRNILAGKELVRRVIKMKATPVGAASITFYHSSLRIKDINLLFTTKNINLN